MPTLLIECGIEGLALRKGDGLRVDLDAGTVHVFRDDDAPALLRGRIPARVTWRNDGGWKFVPCEPTPAMIEAARTHRPHPNARKPDHWDAAHVDTYRRMLAEAPSPGQQWKCGDEPKQENDRA